MELLKTSHLRMKSYHGDTVSDFGLWYRILRFDNRPLLMAQSESKNSIQVIERMTRLLDALAGSPAPASLKHLAQSAALHPSTAHRILSAMVNDRMVERAEQGSYRLGMRLIELGNLAKSRISVREIALPFMRNCTRRSAKRSTCRCGARTRSYTSSAPPAAAR